MSACFGLQATVVGRFPVDRPVIPAFGEYSLEFEGKKIHPVNFIVPWVSQEVFSDATQHRPDFLPLAVQVGTSRMITGFYHDLDRQRLDAPPRISDLQEEPVFQPYSVRFTFHCYRA
ncbi:MAG: hypothetical protein ACPH86_01145 [Schleiferiaceae bacterium]